MRVKPLGVGGVEALLAGESMAGLAQRGKLSWSNGMGFGTFGSTKFGDDRPQGGIYQKRIVGSNYFLGPNVRVGEVFYVKMRSYAPTNPQTTEQQANRTKFADANSAWQSLTNEEKSVYNQRANRKGRVGYFLFMSEYMKSH